MSETPDNQALLEKTWRGLDWLRRNHNDWLEDRPSWVPEEQFGRILDETAGLEKTLRSLGYQGCIFGEKGRCPEDAVITCDHCASVSLSTNAMKKPEGPPGSAAALPAESPGSGGSPQLSLFHVPSPHP